MKRFVLLVFLTLIITISQTSSYQLAILEVSYPDYRHSSGKVYAYGLSTNEMEAVNATFGGSFSGITYSLEYSGYKENHVAKIISFIGDKFGYEMKTAGPRWGHNNANILVTHYLEKK